jgi:hypothetical protein
MSANARRGKGSKFYIGSDDTTEVVAGDAIFQIKSAIPFPTDESEDIDVTNHDSPRNQKEYIQGDSDLGEIELEIVFSEGQHAELVAKKALGKLKMRHCLIEADGTFNGTLPDTYPRYDFIGYIKSIGGETPVDNETITTVTIKVCSDMEYTPDPSSSTV